jgi:pimeloyl-ACP methyl ester carboxylesterase
VLLHGLSAHAMSFGGLLDGGLSPRYRLVAPDLRGRGASEKPAIGYDMSDHAADILALMDLLGLDKVTIAGHSFGGYLGIYLAAKFPGRVTKLVVIDAAITLNPRVSEMLRPSLDRLGRVLPSVDAYLAELRAAPYIGSAWDARIEAYYRAEILRNEDGTAQSATSAEAIAQALEGVKRENWRELVEAVSHPVLLLNALGAYGPPGAPPLVGGEQALETARAFRECRYAEVPGNHLTMVFGEGARVVAREIDSFINS